MPRFYTSCSVLILLCALPATARADLEGYIGQISLFSGNFAPQNWALCEGQLLAISQHAALFTVLDKTYGGDGKASFALPDLRKAEQEFAQAGVEARPRYIICLAGNYPPRGKDRDVDGMYAGETLLFAGNFVPGGCAPCEGQELQVADYQALSMIIGASYGGDGTTTFKLPDLRNAAQKLRLAAGLEKEAKGLLYVIALDGIFPSRN